MDASKALARGLQRLLDAFLSAGTLQAAVVAAQSFYVGVEGMISVSGSEALLLELLRRSVEAHSA